MRRVPKCQRCQRRLKLHNAIDCRKATDNNNKYIPFKISWGKPQRPIDNGVKIDSKQGYLTSLIRKKKSKSRYKARGDKQIIEEIKDRKEYLERMLDNS